MHLTTPTETRLAALSDGVPGILETLKIMSRFVREGKKSHYVRETALRLIRGLSHKDYSEQVRRLHAFVRDHIQYVLDTADVETVATPEKTLEYGAGDCDDKSVLLCALLESIGHKTRFIAIGFQPGVFSHVYAETLIGSKWIPLETTEDVECGWEPDRNLVQAYMQHFN